MKLALASAVFAMSASLCAAQANPASYRERDAKYLRVAYERQMEAAVKSRGDNAIAVALPAMADVVRQANRHSQSVVEPDSPSAAQRDAIAFVAENCRPLELKRQLAMQFEQLGSAGTSLGPTLNQLLVTDRNEAAMKVLRRELASGRRKIAIFTAPLICPTLRGAWRTNGWPVQDDFTCRSAGFSPRRVDSALTDVG